ncbi:hypothetical protein EDB86DRAFT_2949843 [Lactarius hatsudake]|nr:hypothetical protein EDB86DRAFT_2949843 [Lactarius hatsudake]
MTEWLNFFTFGGGFEMMKAGRDVGGLWILLESGVRTMHLSSSLHIHARERRACVERVRVLERLRMGAKGLRKDLCYYLSSEELPESERPSPIDVTKDGQLAIVAGSDTTSSVLTAALYYLICNPDAYERLQAEVDRAFLSGEEPLVVTKLSQMDTSSSTSSPKRVTTHRGQQECL